MDESSAYYQKRAPCFVEEEYNWLASSLEGMEGAGSSSRSFYSTKKRNIPRYSRVYDSRFEDDEHAHFLDSCFLCNKPLGPNTDIFMYRGDTPFCSAECREEQIEADEAKERQKQNINKKQTSSSSSTRPLDCPLRTSTIAVS